MSETDVKDIIKKSNGYVKQAERESDAQRRQREERKANELRQKAHEKSSNNKHG